MLGAAAAILVGLGVLYGSFGGQYGDTFSIPGAEAQELFDVLREKFPERAGDTATVVVKAPDGVDSAGNHARVDQLIADLEALPEVVDVASPYETPGAISRDGTIARISVQYDKQASRIDDANAQALVDYIDDASQPGFQVEAGGSIVYMTEREPPGSSEIIGITAAVIILLIAFGSVVAMGLPIATALLGLTSGFFLIGTGTSFIAMPSFTPQFCAMIGIGVGIDYALLITSRFREALARGLTPEDATVVAASTAGRSVLFAGGTVVIAMLGLWASGIEGIGWVGTASSLVVLTTVLVALVVLPAILGFAGRQIDRWRVPGLRIPDADSHEGMGYRLSLFVQRYPVLCLVVSLGILLALAAPTVDLRLGNSDAGNNPTSFTSRRAYDLISEGFGPGANGPVLVGVIIDNPAVIPQVQALPDQLTTLDDVASVSPVRFNDTQTAAVFTVLPESAPQDQATVDLVHELRRDLRAQFGGTGARPLVGGSTALFIDVGDHLDKRLPVFLGAVILLSFLLLTLVFRSLLVPLKAALMNLLSIGASFGILVAIFQWGWFGGVLGVSREGPVEAFLPMMLFAVLFGLSMDYEVFLVTRIREEYMRTGDNSESVARGLSRTTRVITAAALIMVAVFLAFAFSDQRVIKEFGIGLASAIFLDATVVRLILVPSMMQLAGKWNWWLPSWLDRLLPNVSIEGHELDVAQEPALEPVAR